MLKAAASFADFVKFLFSSWSWKMAWRESRTSRGRLLLFSSSIVLGIAALVAIGSFGRNIERSVDEQARTLLGADLVLSSRDPFSKEEQEFLESVPGDRANEISFSSMVVFPKTSDTRLVQVRALEGEFPFYGQFETDPPEGVAAFREGKGALVEESVLTQYGAKVGDEVRVGKLTVPVVGALRAVPGETVVFSTIAPRVYVRWDAVDDSKLLQPGSLARYKTYYRFPPQISALATIEELRPGFERFGLGHDTVEKRKASLGRAMENLYQFLSLVGFVALLLGGVGVASAIHVHVKQKLPTVAVLRCIGSVATQAFAIYVVQALALGAFGAVAGAALGLAIQTALPSVLGAFLPVALSATLSWQAVAVGSGIGFVSCVLFALVPLLSVRRISPLAVLRSSYEPVAATKDPLVWLVYVLIGGGVLAFAMLQSRTWKHGVVFMLGLLAAFGMLALVAKIITLAVRRIVPLFRTFEWRQGLSSLYRPQNRTVLLTVSLGLGTFLILLLYLTQANLVNKLFPSRPDQLGNAVLFDVQTDQKSAVADTLRTHGLAVLQEAPIVTMRLASVKGEPVSDLLRERPRRMPQWVLQREYRSTYREVLGDSEEILAGEWIGRVEPGTEPVPVSIEDRIADELHLGIGDELVFDVQGLPVATKVASVRKVEWRRMQPNFFVVFPAGVLEEAPAFHVLVTRVTSKEQSAAMQRDIVKRFPNVSALDMTLVLQTVDAVLTKVSFAIRFMALFTVGTGLIVLIGSVMTGRYQRAQESILLRTLGASGRQVMRILFVEYLALGLVAGLAGSLLAIGGSWALAVGVFKSAYSVSWIPIGVTVIAVATLTILAGVFASRGLLKQSPLDVLRSEA